ncbi:DUF2345 domain-containing protein, partial [Acidovorax sp. Leaf191]|uniref:DUF2345 domain-containing protein n=1 Tax=Acidovorax sp. Leaf191 TaxID=1736296 RepID=UPI000A68F443
DATQIFLESKKIHLNAKDDATQIFLESKKIHLNAKDEILLTCGSSTIKLTPGQIEVLSPLDKLNC